MKTSSLNRSRRAPGLLSIGQSLVYGLIGGVVATGVKTLCETIAPPRPPGVDSPLGNVLNAASVEFTGGPLSEAVKQIAEPSAHFVFGVGAAAVYAVVSERLPVLRAGCGAFFGFSLWLGAHEILLPLLGFSPSPAQMSVWEQGNELITHVIYGVTVELVRRGLVSKLA